MKKTYTLNTQFVAALFAQELDGTPEQWQQRLVNWRKPGRTPPLSWSRDTPRPKYDESEVQEFIASRKQEESLLVLSKADPDNELPTARAAYARNEDARPLVKLEWTDRNATGTLVLSFDAAQQLAQTLQQAIADVRAAYADEVNTGAMMDLEALAIRMDAAGPDGELPSLDEALRRNQ